MVNHTKTTVLLSSLSIGATLVIASLASIGMMQTNAADATTGRNIILKERFTGEFARLVGTIEEGGITTTAAAFAFETSEGNRQVCLNVIQHEDFLTFYMNFMGCGPADEFTVANGLGSATFSGMVTGVDFLTGEEKTMTVSGDLTATGQPQVSVARQGFTTPDFKVVQTSNGKIRPASGSLNISGDITLSFDDATGSIENLRQGNLQVIGT
jgi:hypothetical protein